jgi:hypothetical protein
VGSVQPEEHKGIPSDGKQKGVAKSNNVANFGWYKPKGSFDS